MKKTKQNVSILIALALLLSPLIFTASAYASYPRINGRLLYIGSNDYLYSVKPDGSDHRTVRETPVRSASYSPDGTEILYSAENYDGIYKMNNDGSDVELLTNSDGFDADPSWSWDGSKIVFMSDRHQAADYQLFTMNSDGTNVEQITDDIDIAQSAPRFSPDGSQIISSGYTPGVGIELYKMNANGNNITQLTNSGGNSHNVEWSPDGSQLIYRQIDSGQIYKMNADGTNTTTLTSGGSNNGYPVFSPDGSQIAFADVGMESNLLVMNADGSNATVIDSGQFTIDGLSWQPLTIKPSTDSPNKEVYVDDKGKASIDIPSLYTDAYDGIDEPSVTITSEPTMGNVNISDNGVATYTKDNVARSNILSKFFAYIMPTAHAQSSSNTDSFSYRVCSLSSSQLCSTGSVTVDLASSASSTTLASTGQNQVLITLFAIALLFATLYVLTNKKQHG